MAIDYGDARTGVAVSDPTGLLAGYTTVIQSRKPEVVVEELARLGIEAARLTIVDKGALDCVIRARMACAICRCAGVPYDWTREDGGK